MSTPVTITFGQLPAGWCPSGPQDLVNELNFVVDARTATGLVVRIQFGVLLPGFCDPTAAEFIEALEGVTSGYVMDTGDTVHVDFQVPDAEFCWTNPQAIVDWLAGHYSAYVEGT